MALELSAQDKGKCPSFHFPLATKHLIQISFNNYTFAGIKIHYPIQYLLTQKIYCKEFVRS